jgi:hypothetical protein
MMAILSPMGFSAQNNKSRIRPGCGFITTKPAFHRFPTLVLPRSGCEGRPIGRTLSRMAPLAVGQMVQGGKRLVNARGRLSGRDPDSGYLH